MGATGSTGPPGAVVIVQADGGTLTIDGGAILVSVPATTRRLWGIVQTGAVEEVSATALNSSTDPLFLEPARVDGWAVTDATGAVVGALDDAFPGASSNRLRVVFPPGLRVWLYAESGVVEGAIQAPLYFVTANCSGDAIFSGGDSQASLEAKYYAGRLWAPFPVTAQDGQTVSYASRLMGDGSCVVGGGTTQVQARFRKGPQVDLGQPPYGLRRVQ